MAQSPLSLRPLPPLKHQRLLPSLQRVHSYAAEEVSLAGMVLQLGLPECMHSQHRLTIHLCTDHDVKVTSKLVVSCIYISVVVHRGWPLWHSAKQHQKHEDAWKYQQQGRLSVHTAAVYGLFPANTTTLATWCTAQRQRTSSTSNAGAAQSTHSFRAYAFAKHLSAGCQSIPGKLHYDVSCTNAGHTAKSLFI